MADGGEKSLIGNEGEGVYKIERKRVNSLREAAKKVHQPLRGGGGLRAWPQRKKNFFEARKKMWPLSLRGGGVG